MKARKRTLVEKALVLGVAFAASACDGGSDGQGGSGSEGGTTATTSHGGGGSGGTGGQGGSTTSEGGQGGTTSTTDPFNINECETGLATCSPDADCIDTPELYSCVCKPGYEGDGETCTDVDECQLLLADCDPNAICKNSAGGYDCSCPEGFVGDGKTCDARYLAVAAGQYHACAVRTDNSMLCWGLNTSGQVGTGTGDAFFLKPVAAGGATDWTQVTAGAAFTCGLNESQKILCWGTNGNGQLGDGTTAAKTAPNPVGGGFADWVSMDAGSSHVCAIRQDGSLYCWGRNNVGQVGDGFTTDNPNPTLVSTGPWQSVSAGVDFTCGVLASDHTLWCWGLGSSRQLGTGLTANSPLPIQEKTMANDWATVSTGNTFACGIKIAGERYCWGANSVGQGGDGTASTIVDPKAIGTEVDWTQLDAGDGAACGLRGSGALYCWGDGGQGQTGKPGGEGPLLTPSQVGNDEDWTTLADGLRFACGIRTGGALYCWGSASRGALGAGFTSDRPEPTPVGIETTWSQVAIQNDNGCALREAGALWCWGRNAFENLGDGTNVTARIPILIGAGKTWSQITLGRTHTCGIATDAGQNGVYCWGRDGNGELGNGAGTTNQITPMLITPPAGAASDWKEIDAGANHTCAVRADGTLWCWGFNARGQLGDGTKVSKTSATKILPADTADWQTIAAAGEVSCGLRAGGALWCWGRNDNGQLGLGFVSPTADPGVLVPTKVDTANYAAINVGATHVCGVRNDGTLWCWGRNGSGELGLGNSISPMPTPTQVGSETDWLRPVLGPGTSMCASKIAGDLYCWGTGSFGQLGLGSTTSFNTPQKVPSVNPWKTASIGVEHTCGVWQTGALACWGASNFAQLGSGIPFVSVPGLVHNP